MTVADVLQPIDENTPKNRPILAWCDHEADPGVMNKKPDGSYTLTLYAAHAEDASHAPTGFHIIEWGGGWADGEADGGGWLPDWWFVADSEFEQAANPTHWMDLPAKPAKAP